MYAGTVFFLVGHVMSPWKHTLLLFGLFLLLLLLLLDQPQMVLQSCKGNKTTIKLLGIEEMNKGNEATNKNQNEHT